MKILLALVLGAALAAAPSPRAAKQHKNPGGAP
jgi:hypothetical protein